MHYRGVAKLAAATKLSHRVGKVLYYSIKLTKLAFAVSFKLEGA